MRLLPVALTGLVCAIAIIVGGCRRAEQGVFVTAPFNEETRIARVEAHWQPAGGAPAADAETLHFEVRVTNKLADRLFVRLGHLALTDAGGAVLATAADERSCVVGPSAEAVVLSGEVTIPRGAANRVSDFRIERFGVPLSQRGRSIYREFLLRSEKYTEAQVDADIARYMQGGPCS